jgi:TPR repeat protein
MPSAMVVHSAPHGDGNGKAMRLRFISTWAVLTLLVVVSGTWAQSTDAPEAQSIDALRVQADKGDAQAQTTLGAYYRFGIFVPKDCAQALFWFRKAAEQGWPGAQWALGVQYQGGSRTGGPIEACVSKDLAEGAAWYHKAAEQGYAKAQCDLGWLYETGSGVPKDYRLAAFWYRKAADQGDADSQFNLGVLYYNGQGVPQDLVQSAAWDRRAAEQGDYGAQTLLAMLYMNGQGVPQDYAEAYFWSDIASVGTHSGKETAIDVRDATAAKLTPTVLMQTQARARKWFEDHAAKAQTK